MRRAHFLVALLLVGCPVFDTSGVGSGAGTAADTSGTHGSSSSGAERGGAESSSGTSTTSATETTATPDLTSDSGTTAASAVDTESTNEATTAMPTTGDPDGGPYPNCIDPNTCADITHDCIEVFDGMMVVAHLCVPPCLADQDCPLPKTGTAIPFCTKSSFCQLSCNDGSVCPDGMSCIAVAGPEICAYPV